MFRSARSARVSNSICPPNTPLTRRPQHGRTVIHEHRPLWIERLDLLDRVPEMLAFLRRTELMRAECCIEIPGDTGALRLDAQNPGVRVRHENDTFARGAQLP